MATESGVCLFTPIRKQTPHLSSVRSSQGLFSVGRFLTDKLEKVERVSRSPVSTCQISYSAVTPTQPDWVQFGPDVFLILRASQMYSAALQKWGWIANILAKEQVQIHKHLISTTHVIFSSPSVSCCTANLSYSAHAGADLCL